MSDKIQILYERFQGLDYDDIGGFMQVYDDLNAQLTSVDDRVKNIMRRITGEKQKLEGQLDLLVHQHTPNKWRILDGMQIQNRSRIGVTERDILWRFLEDRDVSVDNEDGRHALGVEIEEYERWQYVCHDLDEQHKLEDVRELDNLVVKCIFTLDRLLSLRT